MSILCQLYINILCLYRAHLSRTVLCYQAGRNWRWCKRGWSGWQISRCIPDYRAILECCCQERFQLVCQRTEMGQVQEWSHQLPRESHAGNCLMATNQWLLWILILGPKMFKKYIWAKNLHFWESNWATSRAMNHLGLDRFHGTNSLFNPLMAIYSNVLQWFNMCVFYDRPTWRGTPPRINVIHLTRTLQGFTKEGQMVTRINILFSTGRRSRNTWTET